jgi:hypothetical protein
MFKQPAAERQVATSRHHKTQAADFAAPPGIGSVHLAWRSGVIAPACLAARFHNGLILFDRLRTKSLPTKYADVGN